MYAKPATLLLFVGLTFIGCREEERKKTALPTASAPAAKPATEIIHNEEITRQDMPAQKRDRINTDQLRKFLRESLAVGSENELVHDIDPKAQNVLNGWHGTVISFPANSLVLPDGTTPAGPVTVTLREYYTPAEMLSEGLSTTSGSRLLETGGMVYVEAVAGKRQCRLRDGAQMNISFPYAVRQPGMQLFRGIRRNTIIDWDAYAEEKSDCFLGNGYSLLSTERSSLQRYLAEKLRWPSDTEGPITWWDGVLHFTLNDKGDPEKVDVENPMSPSFAGLVEDVLSKRKGGPVAWTENGAVGAVFTQPISFRWPANNPHATEIAVSCGNLVVDSLLPLANTGTYTFRSPLLGWINCDRFNGNNSEKVQLYVQAAPSDDLDAKLVFHRISSLMACSWSDSGAHFQNIPKGEPVTLVLTKMVGKNIFMSMRTGLSGDRDLGSPLFEKVSVEELKFRLRTLQSPLAEGLRKLSDPKGLKNLTPKI